MKLVDLNPRWTVSLEPGYIVGHSGPARHGMGISFECPIHRKHRLAIFFSNPIDGLSPAANEENYWERAGDSFENLTITPSIDGSENLYGNPGTPCWHGFITNGEVV